VIDQATAGRLRGERRFDEALRQLQSAAAAGLTVDPAVSRAVAEMMLECGRDRDALAVLGGLEADAWAQASASELRVVLGVSDSQSEIAAARQAQSAGEDSDRACWLRTEVRLLRGVRADEPVSRARLEEVRRLLDGSWPQLPPPTRALLMPERALVGQLLAGLAVHHEQEMAAAHASLNGLLEECEQMREPAGELPQPWDDARLALLLEQGRLELLERDWSSAIQHFEELLRHRPDDQQGNVWRVYACRLQGHEQRSQIDRLLGSAPSQDGEVQAAAAGEGDRAYPPVCRPELRARLLAERAATLEAYAPQRALVDYEQALELRPGFTFARRGALRCLAMVDQSGSRAQALAEALRAAAESTPNEGDRAELLVEVGRLALAQCKFDEALKLFNSAIEALPSYGYAYERKVLTLRLSGRHRQAREVGRVICAAPEKVRGVNGVLLELGLAMLELCAADPGSEVREIVDLFERGTEDQSSEVRDRAWAGLIHTYRYERDFARAKATLEQAQAMGEADFRVSEAAGWLVGDLGDFTQALELFDRGLDEHPFEQSLITAKSTALRRLGRTEEAVALLKEKQGLMGIRRGGLESALGWAELDCEHPDDALEHFRRALERYEQLDSAQRGYIAAASRSWPFAESHAIRVRKLRAELVPTEVARGAFLTELGRWCALRGAVPEASSLFREANSLPGLADGPGSVNQRLVQGDSFMLARAYDDAQRTLLQLVERDRARFGGDPNVRLLQGSLVLARTEDLPLAQEIFGEVAGRCPRSHPAAVGLAAVASRRGDWKSALRLLDELARAPDGAELSTVARELAVRARIEAHAEPDEQRALERECAQLVLAHPHRPQPLIAAAILAVARGDLASAWQNILGAKRMAPLQLEPVREVAWIALCVGDLDEAAAALEWAAKIDPRDPRLHVLWGVLHLERDEPTLAIREIRQACAFEPSSCANHVALALALEAARATDHAVQVLSDALPRIPLHDRARIHRERARMRYTLAVNDADTERRSLLEDAAQDGDQALALARDGTERAEAHFYLGAIHLTMGQTLAAKRALKRCVASERRCVHAQEASRLLSSMRRGGIEEAYTRAWGRVLGFTTLILLIALICLAIAGTVQSGTYVPACGVLLFWLAVTAFLPRLSSLKVSAIGSISVRSPEPGLTRPPPSFRRFPRDMLSGPGIGLPAQITPDIGGPAL
jgi:tetratricopeptide (TPR) repeat protein